MTWDQIVKAGLSLTTIFGLAWFGWRVRKMFDAEAEVKKAKEDRAEVLSEAARLADEEADHERRLTLITNRPIASGGIDDVLSGLSPADTSQDTASKLPAPGGSRKGDVQN